MLADAKQVSILFVPLQARGVKNLPGNAGAARVAFDIANGFDERQVIDDTGVSMDAAIRHRFVATETGLLGNAMSPSIPAARISSVKGVGLGR